MSNQQYKTIVRRLNEALFSAGGDLSVIDEFVAADLVDHSAPPQMQHGSENLRRQALAWRAAFPDLTLTVDELVAEGDVVVVAWRGSGTHLGDLMGIAPTGVKGYMDGISFHRLQDGLIVERWGNSDQAGLFVQLGLIPAPAGK
jgi:predicted ester cyclase